MASVVPTVKLNDGTDIPALAFGTGTAWYKPDRFAAANPEMVAMAAQAIKAGYRHLDTAEGYGTEVELGQAIKESGIPRDQFYVATKGVNTIHEGTVDDMPKAIEDSLQRLGLDYVDLYLLHSPYVKGEKYDEASVAKAWKHMETLQRAGKIRSLGVSDFRKHHLENLLKTAEIKPVINQIQFNPYLQGAPQFAKWSQSQGIATSTWMGLAPITHLKGMHLKDTLESLSTKYGVSEATILIRWQLDLGCVVINTTKKLERFQEYFAATSLKLSEEDHEKITKVGQEKHVRVPVPALYDGGEHGPYEY